MPPIFQLAAVQLDDQLDGQLDDQRFRKQRFCRTFGVMVVILSALAMGSTVAWAAPPVDSVVESQPNADSLSVSLGVRKISGVSYSDQPDGAGLCDVFLPIVSKDETGQDAVADKNAGQQRRWPVILIVHGGGWATGNKWTMDRHARQLTKRGFASVAINYRLAPAFKFPAQLDDVRTAMAWISDHADEHHFDLERVGLFGYSAGGHLVSLAATLADEPWSTVKTTTAWPKDDPRWKKLPKIKAVCAGGPPTNFQAMPLDNTSLAYFLGGSRREIPHVYQAASPICFVSQSDPPLKIIHGEADGIVPFEGSQEFCQAADLCNGEVSLMALPRNGHLLAFLNSKLTQGMLAFFVERLGTTDQTPVQIQRLFNSNPVQP